MQKRLSIKKEILLVLIVKLILLFGIWFFCFSKPLDKHSMPVRVASHIFNLPAENTHD